MQIINIQITPPATLVNTDGLPLWNEFYLPIYQRLYALANPATLIYPHIDFDTFKNQITPLLAALAPAQLTILKRLGPSTFNNDEWNRAPEHKAIMVFLWKFLEFANLLTNIHLLAPVAIKSSEIYLNINIDSTNFIRAKQFIDQINRVRWTRAQNQSERQSGVSNLGSVSESLLEIAMNQLIDGVNFFKTNNQQVQSYGDFVLMCLPNNLWLSVKSNFARERLLASGYTTDILGVGFFTSKDEFTSKAKIRNFQRVGFLAMYLPDIPVSEDQVNNNTNTYDEVMAFYAANAINLPININGTQFLRPLSGLHADISSILAIADVSNRTTLSF